MNVETFIVAILGKMTGISKCQLKFFPHIALLYLSMRTRLNYLMFWRHGKYCPESYGLNFEKPFDFALFNTNLINVVCGQERLLFFDPSYLSKSGKKTPGVGYFWSGCASAVKWGLELMSIAIGDVENHSALHYSSALTKYQKGKDSLRMYYANWINKQATVLQKISKVLVVDAFFSKKPFIDSLCASKFTVVTRLQKNVIMRYKYEGGKRQGRGRPQTLDGQIDIKNVSTNHFRLLQVDNETRIYEGLAHVRCFKRWCKVAIVHYMKDNGEVDRIYIYCSTDPNLEGIKVFQYYKLRYQIEYLFRDAKGFVGLEDSQSRKEKAINFHCNLSLTVLNIAKAMHWYSIPKADRKSFSMSDIKTQYGNEFLLDKLIKHYGKDPLIEKNKPKIKKIYELGRITA